MKKITFLDKSSDWCLVWSWFFYWRKELVWADLLNTLNMVVKCVENFLQSFGKKFYPKKQVFDENWVSKRVGTSGPNPVFWGKKFSQRTVEHFLRTIRPCSRYSEGPLRLVLYVSKKSWSYDTPIWLFAKKSEFFSFLTKIMSQNGLGLPD